MSQLGMMHFCRTIWILGYAEISEPLSDLVHLKLIQMNKHVQWTPEDDPAFEQLKVAVIFSL